MRYSIRKKVKIYEKLGEAFLNDLISMLELHFKGEVEIKENTLNIHYPIIEINKEGNTHVFAVVGKKYDVLNLSYCKTIKHENINS